jgi:GGDEF domain-containing protein
MKANKATGLRGWILGLILAALVAGFLIANINTYNINLVYLGLFLIVVAMGLLTNPWGGLIASSIAVFALLLLNQYVSINPLPDNFVNLASEMVVFLVAGPLAGWFSQVIETRQAQLDHLISEVESQSTHDMIFNTLKPEWGEARLEEEAARAISYKRPLSIAVLQFVEQASQDRDERVAAIQALIRVVRSTTASPSVVSYYGENRVLLILPEHTGERALMVLNNIRKRADTELYFVAGGAALGNPLGQWGKLRGNVASLAPGDENANDLLQRATLDPSSG